MLVDTHNWPGLPSVPPALGEKVQDLPERGYGSMHVNALHDIVKKKEVAATQVQKVSLWYMKDMSWHATQPSGLP